MTDRGGEFTGAIFRKTVARLGARHRFGTTNRLFATARLERSWRTLKESAGLRLYRPLTVSDLEARLEMAPSHYLLHRPHQGLAGATPAELFLGSVPAARHAGPAPRGQPGDGPRTGPFHIEYLDVQRRRLPFLSRVA